MPITSNCSYTYQGKTYSREGLLRVLSRSTPGMSEKAKEFLRVKLGMPDTEVQVVLGLIDGKALGRFKADGRILLSSFANDSVVYHEAFHRVFRRYLTPAERESFLKRVSSAQAAPYRDLYPEESENDWKEEFLADQFADFMLNDGDIKLQPEIRSLFTRLMDFIRKVLGLKGRTIRSLYDDIAAGLYQGQPVDPKDQYSRSADKVLIGGKEYTSDVKNEFVQALSRLFVNELVSQNSMYDFIRDGVDPSLTTDLYDSLHLFLTEQIAETNPELAEALLDDHDLGKRESYVFQQFKQYIETLMGKVTLTAVEEGERLETEEEGKGEEDKGRQQDDVTWKASFEIDPKTSMSKAIKLLLASFEDSNQTSSLGFYKQVRWTNAFNKIARHLAGVPTRDSIAHLAKLEEPWVDRLIDYLGGLDPDGRSIDSQVFRLRNEFIKTFSKTEHTYVISEVSDEGVKWFDANQDTGKKKVVKSWRNNTLLAIKQRPSFEAWVSELEELVANRNADDLMYENLLGITVDDELKSLPLYTVNNEDYYFMSSMNAIGKYILKSIRAKKFSNETPPDYNKLFDKNNFDVEGTIEKIADAQLEYEDAVDLMLFSRDKKLYGISLNTHTTTTLNTLNYLTSQIDPSWPLERKLELVDSYLPDILNYQTVERVDGEYRVKSEWLKTILDGNKVQMVIIDGMTSTAGDNEATADINETDLYAMTLNLSLNGVNISIKHSDRSVFFGYKTQRSSIFDYQDKNTQNEKEVVNYLTTVLQDQLATEVRRANLTNVPMIDYFRDKYRDSQLFSQLTSIDKLNPYTPEIETMVRKVVQAELQRYKDELTRWGIINPVTKTSIGVDPELVKYHNGDLDLVIASSFANQVMTHLEEMRILLGDFAFFKNADDFYKRMSTTSGTGENLVNDVVTNERIARLNERKFQIYNPKLGVQAEADWMTYDKQVDGTMTTLTVAEKSDYLSPFAHDLNKVSPIDGERISTAQFVFEWNLMQDAGSDLTDQQKKQVKEQAKGYAAAYGGINENDGQAWMNMFFYREYMLRLGQWSDEMNNLFIAELQILNARSEEELRNITIPADGKQIKVFDWPNWTNGWFDSVNTLKSQYAGFTKSYAEYRDGVIQDYSQRIRPYTIYKTSNHVLWPSTIWGTNLSQMHYFMLKNKVDVIHMGSANKSGAINPGAVFRQFDDSVLTEDQKLAKSQGYQFYDSQGLFNDTVFEGEVGANALRQSLAVANIDSYKDQVRIGNHEKTEIKGSTQSLKILLSNLMENGVPRFEGADILVNDYKRVVAELVTRTINDLKKDVGYSDREIQDLDKLVDLIQRAAEDRSSPVNVIEAIEAFAFEPFMETLPNRTKLENIFYSVITNNAISFNRPGNSYPQVASTGFEPIGSRTVLEGTKVITNDDLVKFYTVETNEEGAITRVNPAEIIIPLPKAWIPSVLAAAKTENVGEALAWLNDRIASGKVDTEITFKALRIPNQQLSSNDIVKVKRFDYPTNVNYAIVPSELVAKTGGDFDIDKLNVYFANGDSLFAGKFSDRSKPLTEQIETELQSTLIQLEKDILLHPRNAHMLLMPVIDDLLKKDAYSEIAVRLKGLPAKDTTTYVQALTPQKNVEKAIDFVKSKFGVGFVALHTTGHAVFQVDNISLNTHYVNADNERIPLALRFAGVQGYSLSKMYDQSGRIISEIQSQTMNSQVDAGKDPYAVKLGISNQTLDMILYLNRRGVGVKQALKFINQPLIQSYLTAQRVNESLINKQRGDELSKFDLVDSVLIGAGYARLNDTIYDFDNPRLTISDDMLNRGFRGDQTDQLQLFSYFLRLVDEVAVFNDLKNSLTVDTKGKKDKAAVEAFRSLQNRVVQTGLIPGEQLNLLRTSGLLGPFHEAQDLYEQFYDPFYAVQQSGFGGLVGEFKEFMADRQRGAFKKEKVRKQIDNDFVMFIIQNFHSDFSLPAFNKIFGIEGESLAEELRELQKDSRFENNPVIKAFFPMISIAKDELNGKTFDAIRLFERELTAIDVNDYIDGMRDIKDEVSEDLYKAVVQASLYQAGFLNSPFSINRVLPTFESSRRDDKGKLVEFENEYLRSIQLEAVRLIQQMGGRADALFPVFKQLFYLNNPEFLPKKYFKSSQIPYFYILNKGTKKREIKYIVDPKIPSALVLPLGNTYMKRYFNELFAADRLIPETKKPAKPDVEYTEYEEVFPLGLPSGEGIQENNDIEVLKTYLKGVTSGSIKTNWFRTVPINLDVIRNATSIDNLVTETQLKIADLDQKIEEYETDPEKNAKAISNVNNLIQGYGALIYDLQQLKSQRSGARLGLSFSDMLDMGEYRPEQYLGTIREVLSKLPKNPIIDKILSRNDLGFGNFPIYSFTPRRGDDTLGFFEYGRNEETPYILINLANKDTLNETILHEAIHAYTISILANDTVDRLDPNEQLFKNEIESAYKIARTHIRENFYGMSNTKEFIAEAMADSRFRARLSKIPVKSDIVTDVTVTEQLELSVWDKVLNAIYKLFGSVYTPTETTRVEKRRGMASTDMKTALDQIFFDYIESKKNVYRYNGRGEYARMKSDLSGEVLDSFPGADHLSEYQKNILNRAFDMNSNDAQITCKIG